MELFICLLHPGFAFSFPLFHCNLLHKHFIFNLPLLKKILRLITPMLSMLPNTQVCSLSGRLIKNPGSIKNRDFFMVLK